MSKEDYLALLAATFGFDNIEDAYATDPPYADTYDELVQAIVGVGIEVGEWREMGDGYWAVWDDGELKMTAYISTRGHLFQAGAYDGEEYFFATNVASTLLGAKAGDNRDGHWHLGSSVCGEIAARGWQDAHGELETEDE